MKKTIDTLIDQTEECLRKYAEKPNWVPEDVMAVKSAVSAYEKLLELGEDCEEATREGMSMRSFRSMRGASMARGRDANTGRFVSRAPRYYEYDGNMTAYGRGGSYGSYGPYGQYDDRAMGQQYSGAQNNGRGGNQGQSGARSMHSINDRMIQQLEMLMDEAQSDYEREQVREMIGIAEKKNR